MIEYHAAYFNSTIVHCGIMRWLSWEQLARQCNKLVAKERSGPESTADAVRRVGPAAIKI